MDIRRLHYFCTIVEQGQISRAAKALNISQPPLSQRLKELEDEFGTPLIMREGRTWQVTEAGKVLYERAQHLLTLIDEIPAEVMNAAEGFQGRLMVGVSSMCMSYVLHATREFSRLYPNARHHIVLGDSGTLEGALKRREIDVAVLLLPVVEDLFNILPLPSSGCSVVLSNALAETLPVPPADRMLQLEDLVKYPLALPRRARVNGTWDRLMMGFQTRHLEPHVLLDCQDIQTLLAFIETGVPAAAVVPASEVPPGRAGVGYQVRALDAADLRVQPAVVTLRQHHLTHAARALIAEILKEGGRRAEPAPALWPPRP